MSDQTFLGPVGDVAGRDINIYWVGTKRLAECSREELEHELDFALKRRAALRWRLWTHPGVLWFLCVSVVLAVAFFKGYLFYWLMSGQPMWSVVIAASFMVGVIGTNIARRKYGPAIGELNGHIDAVRTMLLIRH